VDFTDDVISGPYTPELLDEMMALLKGMGVRRVYWQYYGDVEPGSYWAMDIYRQADFKYGSETLDRIGQPLAAAVPAAHRHGLQIYGVLKPYDTGFTITLPEGSPEAADAPKVARIGGRPQWVVPFIGRYPHMRVRRRPYKAPAGLQTLAVKKIRLLKQDDSPTRVRKENLQIWASPVNYRYERKDVEFTLKEAVEPAPREVRDRDGGMVTARGAPVRTLTLEGLELADKYILVTTNYKDQRGDFRNTPVGMVEAYGNGPEPLPITVATRMAMRPVSRDFRTYGLEFDGGYGNIPAVLDVDNAAIKKGDRSHWSAVPTDGLIALARGKNDYVAGVLCEAEPEVRKLWSGWIDRIIGAGVDGVDIRMNSHGNPTNEPLEYGFNEPLVGEYRRRFGADLLAEGADLSLLARLRGEHFTRFIRETSDKVRQAGKKMQVHVHTEAWRPNPTLAESFWMLANIDFEWKAWLRKGMVDGIMLRGGALEDPVMEEAVTLAQELGLPVYRNRKVGGIGMDEYVSDLESVFRDERFAGFNVYEVFGIARPKADGSKLVAVGNTGELIRAKAQELGVI
jgi:hypothetical protein